MKKNKAKYLVYFIIISYVIAFIISKSGYYEYNLRQKSIITNKQMEEFEEDVKNDVNVKLKDYTAYNKYDYTSKVGDITYKTTTEVNKVMKKSIVWFFKKMNKLTN